jgi:hypothetical protein
VRAGGGGGQAAAAQGPHPRPFPRRPGLSRHGSGPGRQWGLWRVMLPSEVATSADLVSSLLLPSVRVFSSFHPDVPSAVLTACALRQAGYTHTWGLICPALRASDEPCNTVRAVVACNVVDAGCVRIPCPRG